jgi:hypothetical protein
MGELLDVIHSTNIHPLGGMVDAVAFRAFSYGERRFLTGGIFSQGRWHSSGAASKPYFLVYDHCLHEAATKTKAGKKLLFLFDQQKTFESHAMEQFAKALAFGEASLREKYHGVLFQSRLEVPGLQAADLYAHCWHGYATDEEKFDAERRVVLEALTLKRPGMKFYNAEHMERLCATLSPDAREIVRATVDPNASRA